jgi:pilus assembly protein CpaE
MENKKILIIDGDAASRNYLSMMLRNENYSIELAATGKAGLIIAWKEHPDFIIVDPILTDISGMDLVTRLRQDRRTSFAKIIALGGPCDQTIIDDLLQGGFNEYLVKSNEAMERLIAIVAGKDQKFNEIKGGKIIAFLSAKGGTGTSSICTNIAMSVGKKHNDLKVAVVDLVLPVGSIANIVGSTDGVNLINLLDEIRAMEPEYLKEKLPKLANWNFSLLAGSPDPESANEMAVGRIPAVISAMQSTFDYIFVDLGTSLSRISLPILLKANVLVLIMSNDLSTVTLTNTVWKYLKNKGVNPNRVYPLLNRAVGLQGLTKTEVEKKLGFQVRITIPNMGDNFTVANNRHEPILLKFPTDSSVLVIEQTSRQIVEMSKRPL